jgi:ribosome-binding ATPase YchF (GTP1/OBG family)
VQGIPGIPLGNRNVKDPRLDEVDRLVEAKKRVYARVETVSPKDLATADAVLTSADLFPDLLLHDLEFIENRLGRNPGAEEAAVLRKLQAALEDGTPAAKVTLTDEERAAVAAHRFLTDLPIVVATEAEPAEPDRLLFRAFQEAGFISFFTVGGKENRAWPIPAGTTAVEAAGSIHTDLQKGFIRAEVISFADLVEHGGEKEAKRAGCQRLETKNYVVRDCDIINFRFNK